jgi:hypothetical protein
MAGDDATDGEGTTGDAVRPAGVEDVVSWVAHPVNTMSVAATATLRATAGVIPDETYPVRERLP